MSDNTNFASLDTFRFSQMAAAVAQDNNKSRIESEEQFFATDLICEGPIEGLVDANGSLLKYINSSNLSISNSNIILSRGIYYDDVPVLDTSLDRFNFSNLNFAVSYGEELPMEAVYPSTVFRYNKRMYLNNTTPAVVPPDIGNGALFSSSFFIKTQTSDDIDADVYPGSAAAGNGLIEKNTNLAETIKRIDATRLSAGEFTHKIVNKYCDYLKINLSIDSLFEVKTDGSISSAKMAFAVEISKDTSNERLLCYFFVKGIVKGSQTLVEIPFNLDLDTVNANSYYVKVYSCTKRIASDNATEDKSFSINSIVEQVRTRGGFCHPFSALVKTGVASKSFSTDPARSFDLKLLKVKVPDIYDSESKTYRGSSYDSNNNRFSDIWTGKFDSFLRWTDNPAWIFYDICTNARYGMGRSNIIDSDLNKWDLFQIAKYCDELVEVKTPLKYDFDNFTINPDASYPNTILIEKDTRSISDFKTQYPPVYDEGTNYADITLLGNNGGYQNSIISLLNLKNKNGSVAENFRKIIWSVDAVSFDGREVSIKGNSDASSATHYMVTLMNDFGPRKFFEKNNTFFNAFAEKLKTNLELKQITVDQSEEFKAETKIDLKKNISAAKLNTEDGAKEWILMELASLKRNPNNQNNTNNYIVNSYLNDRVFPSDLDLTNLSGQCSPKVKNYREALEPRFTGNIYIDNETEALKLINDLSSIFRGITYYKNNLITSTIDVDKEISYLFNNTNVKDGIFTYSSGSLDGNYTVAKVFYRDKYNNFSEQVEVVEDSLLIREYGIIPKEILGFGVTSRDQARRLGLWMLATNRFENETVTFNTSLQGSLLKPSDIIQIEDQYKNSINLQGRVISVNYTEGYVVVDRKLRASLTGNIIKFLFINNLFTDDSNIQNSIDYGSSSKTNNVFEMKVDRIDNTNNRVYLDQNYVNEDGENTFDFMGRIIASCPFIIVNKIKNQNIQKLYKIVSISEEDVNSYNVFCIRHDNNKYSLLDKGQISDSLNSDDNTISFSNFSNLVELDLSEIETTDDNSYYKIENLNNSPDVSSFNFSFHENSQTLRLEDDENQNFVYQKLSIYFSKIKDFIIDNKDDADPDNYYTKVYDVLRNNGGFLVVLYLRNQSIKFSVPYSIVQVGNDTSNTRSIFLGRFYKTITNAITPTNGIRIYLYNKENKIVQV